MLEWARLVSNFHLHAWMFQCKCLSFDEASKFDWQSISWLFKLCLYEKETEHRLHTNGFSFKCWVLMCPWQSDLFQNLFIQYWHWTDFFLLPSLRLWSETELNAFDCQSLKWLTADSDWSKSRSWFVTVNAVNTNRIPSRKGWEHSTTTQDLKCLNAIRKYSSQAANMLPAATIWYTTELKTETYWKGRGKRETNITH